MQAFYSTIDFDYFDYSSRRWAQHHRTQATVRAFVLAHFAPPMGEPLSAPFPPAFPEAPAEEVPVEAPKPTMPVIHGEAVPPVSVSSVASAAAPGNPTGALLNDVMVVSPKALPLPRELSSPRAAG